MVKLLSDPQSADWTKTQAFTICRSGGESIRDYDYRFTHWGFGKKGSELYDLKKDPGEFNNLAGDPEYKAVVEKMRLRLIAARAQSGFEKNKVKITGPKRKN